MTKQILDAQWPQESAPVPTVSSIWKTLADISQRIRRILLQRLQTSISRAVLVWKRKGVKAGRVEAQWGRPLMRRGQVCDGGGGEQ